VIFDVSGLTPTQRAIVDQALVRCQFDFDLLAPGLAREGRSSLRVSFGRAEGNYGIAYLNEGRLEVAEQLVGDPEFAGAVFQHEMAHFVDRYMLSDRQRREIARVIADPQEPTDWWGSDYWDQMGEAWANAFVDAFSSYNPADFGYRWRSSDRIAKAVRRIVAPDVDALIRASATLDPLR
jgi:hypothetical protein